VVHLALRHLADDLTGPAHDTLVATFAARPPRRTKLPQEASGSLRRQGIVRG